MIGDTGCPLERTVKMTSLARDTRRPPECPHYRGLEPPQVVLCHRRHGHPVEGQRGDRGADGSLPLGIGREAGKATQGAAPRLLTPGQHRARGHGASNGDFDAELAEGCRQWDGNPPEQHRRGALFSPDPGAGLVHADVLSRDPQPLFRRGDHFLEGGRAQGRCLGVVCVARRPSAA